MERNQKKQDLEDKLAQCLRLAGQLPEGVTAQNLRELASELEQKIRKLDKQAASVGGLFNAKGAPAEQTASISLESRFGCGSCVVSWSRAFDDPIKPPKGKTIVTLKTPRPTS